MAEYPSNAKKQKKVKPVIEGGAARIRETPPSKRLLRQFVAEDAKSVSRYILSDVIVPATKNLVYDIASQSVQRILWGEVKSVSRGITPGRSTYTPYNKVREITQAKTSWERNLSDRNLYDFGELIVDSRGDAEVILEGLNDILDEYQVVSVADLYELAGMTHKGDYTGNSWGWTNLKGASVEAVREGYLVKLPKPTAIK